MPFVFQQLLKSSRTAMKKREYIFGMMRHSTPQVGAPPNNLDIRGVPGIGVGHLGDLAARFLLDSASLPAGILRVARHGELGGWQE